MHDLDMDTEYIRWLEGFHPSSVPSLPVTTAEEMDNCHGKFDFNCF